MYHYVRPRDSSPFVGIHGPTPERFVEELESLCRAFEPVSWPQFHAWHCGQAAIPSKSFLLTFDDGLSDHARFVEPILNERRLKGLFFVPGIVLNERIMLAAHALHVLLGNMEEQELEVAASRLVRQWSSQCALPEEVNSERAVRMYHYESPTRARLKYWFTVELPIELRDRIVRTLFEQHIGPYSQWAVRSYLSLNDLSRMQSKGHAIGGHGFSHEPCLRLDSRQQFEDMKRIATMLQSELRPAPRPFSYPFGSFNQTTQDACKRTGFAAAFTTQARRVDSLTDPWAIPRFDENVLDRVLAEET